MKVPFEQVKALRERTGCSLQKCKEALSTSSLNMDAAAHWLSSGSPGPPEAPEQAGFPDFGAPPTGMMGASCDFSTPPSAGMFVGMSVSPPTAQRAPTPPVPLGMSGGGLFDGMACAMAAPSSAAGGNPWQGNGVDAFGLSSGDLEHCSSPGGGDAEADAEAAARSELDRAKVSASRAAASVREQEVRVGKRNLLNVRVIWDTCY